jgi:hypothetical protein
MMLIWWIDASTKSLPEFSGIGRFHSTRLERGLGMDPRSPVKQHPALAESFPSGGDVGLVAFTAERDSSSAAATNAFACFN